MDSSKLEKFGKVISAGFGDKVLAGVVTGFLRGVSPERACEYIRDDLNLGYWLSEERWQKYKRLIKGAAIQALTTEDIIAELKKHRLDLLGIILNHPEGRKWLDSQVEQMKKKLGLED